MATLHLKKKKPEPYIIPYKEMFSSVSEKQRMRGKRKAIKKAFPRCFNGTRLLKIGIYHDMLEIGISAKTARDFLYLYTHTENYKELLKHTTIRANLCGDDIIYEGKEVQKIIKHS